MKRDQTDLAGGVAVTSTLSARRTSEYVVVIIVVEGLDGLGLCSGNRGGRGDISVELHCATSANAGGDEEED